MEDRQEPNEQVLLREQWGHVVETARFMIGLAVQSWGFLIAADSALLAFGLSKNRDEALYVAAAMPLLMGVVALVVAYSASPVIYTALVTEEKLGPPAPLITQFAQQRAPSFVAAVKEKDPNLSGTLRDKLPRVVLRRAFIFWLTMGGFVAQLAFAISRS